MSDINEDKLVGCISEIVALKCGMHPTVAKRLRSAAALHDIGKQKIPAEIINKTGKLTKEEFEIMKTHTAHGAKMLESIQGEIGAMARTIAMLHHEWYDSTGSYWGKYSCDYPLYVSIVGISDVFVALLSVRAYKSAWPPEKAIEYINSQAGKQFSPMLTETFIELVRRDENIRALFTDKSNTGG